MKVDYGQAARRHWEDAGYLEAAQRVGNADQLYGVAAECALKAVMVKLGAATTSEGDLRKGKTHLPQIWDEFWAFASGRTASRYLAVLGQSDNPFTDWQIYQRYAADSSLPSVGAMGNHKQASRACMDALDLARNGI